MDRANLTRELEASRLGLGVGCHHRHRLAVWRPMVEPEMSSHGLRVILEEVTGGKPARLGPEKGELVCLRAFGQDGGVIDLADQMAGDPAEVVRMRVDYRQALGDLHLGYLRAWREWARRRGAVIRNHADGGPGNMLDACGMGLTMAEKIEPPVQHRRTVTF